MSTTYHDLSAFTYVRNHASAEEFAEFMVESMGATSRTSAVSIREILEFYAGLGTPVDRKTIYNKLTRVGFVKVVNNGHNSYFYHLQYMRPVAEDQGAKYYPKHLGVMVGMRVPREMSVGSNNEVDITGTFPFKGAIESYRVRALELDDDVVLNGSMLESLDGIKKALLDPVTNRLTIDNAAVLFVGIHHWLEKLESMSAERKEFITEALSSREA